jgi:malate dehydrogenase (oxaloacetate-decarboxylating)
MDYKENAMKKHREWAGKFEITSRIKIETLEELAVAYTPGVAEPCLAIQKDVNESYNLTRRWNTVAVVTDGTAVLGLGDIGPEAGMPVMEGKCILFKNFGDVDAIPLCIKSKDVDEIVKTIALLSGSFGGINLEDISAPRCFEIEAKLKEATDIPIFHDDQHGTAIVVGAGLKNALKLANKKEQDVKVVILGAGAAGVSIAYLMIELGYKNIILCGREGTISSSQKQKNEELQKIASKTNPQKIEGTLEEVIKGTDIFIGVSGPNVLSESMVKSMAERAIVFALANPTPEIMPDIAKKAGAFIVASGRSDFENQINNVLVFPGIFRGALDSRAKDINIEMKIAAVNALANVIDEKDLKAEYIIPSAFNKEVAGKMAEAVKEAAIKSGVSRL